MLRLTEAEFHRLSDALIGICAACGEFRDCTEPDAEGYPCEFCEADAVQGIENALIDGLIDIVD
jgi:hypothetical protein